jgi:hypothetical protein
MRTSIRTSVFLMAVLAVLVCAQQGMATLAGVGPVDASNGFPQNYRGGVSVAPCLDVFNAVAVSAGCMPFTAEPTFDPSRPMIFPSNFPSEFFYWVAEPAFDAVSDPGGNVRQIRFALEGAFLNEVPVAGEQLVFAHKRFQVIVPAGATITIAHPYGTDVITDGVAPDRLADGEINVNFDEPAGAPLDFNGVLASGLIGPRLLRWDRTAPSAPCGYIGDFLVGHSVTGGKSRNNITITGPGINLTTNLWFVAGKTFQRNARPVLPTGIPDTITVTRANFATPSGTWSISGRGTVPGNTVTVTLGATSVSTATVQRSGVWRVLVRNSPLIPNPGASIAATSNGGGSQAHPVAIR